MKKSIIALFLLSALGASSQQLFDKLDATGALNRNRPSAKMHQNAQGSPYLSEAFLVSQIPGVEGNVRTRYNAEKDEIEVQNDQGKIFLLNKNEEYPIVVSPYVKYTLKLVHYKNSSDESVYGYLVEVYSADGIAALRRDKIYLKDEKQAANSYDSYVPAKYTKAKDEFYLELKDKSVILFPSSKKKFIALFPDKKDKLTAFFKDNDFDTNEEDLTKLVNFMATL